MQPIRPRELLVEVDLNGQTVSYGALVLRTLDDVFLFSADDLRAWRLRVPEQAAAVDEGHAYFALPPEVVERTRLDLATLKLTLKLAPQAFESLEIAKTFAPKPVAAHPIGGFMNYDVVAQGSGAELQPAAVLELGAFGVSDGVVITKLLAQPSSPTQRVVRLDTTWTRDFPQDMRTLRVGDVTSVAGTWGGAVRLGGVQFGTNFATRPGFITTPVRAVSGEAALPSVVDVYVNNVLALQSRVPPGPFSITNLPLISGDGQITTVVTDMLGRQHVVTESFASAATLLRRGLDDFSLEGGLLRRDWGQSSDAYGPVAAAGTYRRGFSNTFTGELHGEWTPRRAALGAGATWVAAPLGVVSAALALCAEQDAAAPTGVLLQFGLQHVGQALSYTANVQAATPGFVPFGTTPATPGLRRRIQIGVGQAFGAMGSLSLGMVAQSQYGPDAVSTRIVQIGQTLPLGRWGFLGAALMRTLAGPQGPGTSVALNLTVPLGQGSNAGVALQPGHGGWQFNWQRNLPTDQGWGAQVQADAAQRQVQAQYLGALGLYSAGLSMVGTQPSWRLGAQGGVGWLGGRAFLARRLDGSFALVRVPELGDVRIDANNRPVGRTDSRGELIVPALDAYERNVLSVHQADLPIEASVGALSVPLVPAFRSGSIVDFPIHRVRSALVRLVREDDQPLPAGALASIVGRTEEFPVGDDGQTFLAGLGPSNHIVVHWDDGECRLILPFPPSADAQPNLGTRECRGKRVP